MNTNKSFSTETSERYSRALFEVAKDSKELDKIEMDVKNIQLLFSTSSDIKNFIQNPTISIDNQNTAVNFLAEKLNFAKNLKKFYYY